MSNFKMDHKLREVLKEGALLLLGGALYICVEMLWRGHSHWTMGLVGGVCFVLIGGLNNYLPWEMSLAKQAAFGAAMITAVELVAGVVLNLFLGMGIWDYTGMPLNLAGQICVPYTVLWFLLSFLCIFADDCLRWKLFGERKPRYKLI